MISIPIFSHHFFSLKFSLQTKVGNMTFQIPTFRSGVSHFEKLTFKVYFAHHLWKHIYKKNWRYLYILPILKTINYFFELNYLNVTCNFDILTVIHWGPKFAIKNTFCLIETIFWSQSIAYIWRKICVKTDLKDFSLWVMRYKRHLKKYVILSDTTIFNMWH